MTIQEKRQLVKDVYRRCRWGATEHKANCEDIGIALKKVDDYDDAELDIFIEDFRKHGMI